jgi:hypothetical protein
MKGDKYMGFREPAPDGRIERDGKPLFVLPENTLLKDKYYVTYFTAGGMSVAYTTFYNEKRYFIKEVEATDSQRVMALIQERFMLERLNHPGIVKVRDFFEYDGFYYLWTFALFALLGDRSWGCVAQSPMRISREHR